MWKKMWKKKKKNSIFELILKSFHGVKVGKGSSEIRTKGFVPELLPKNYLQKAVWPKFPINVNKTVYGRAYSFKKFPELLFSELFVRLSHFMKPSKVDNHEFEFHFSFKSEITLVNLLFVPRRSSFECSRTPKNIQIDDMLYLSFFGSKYVEVSLVTYFFFF